MCVEFKNSDDEGAKPVKVSQVRTGTSHKGGKQMHRFIQPSEEVHSTTLDLSVVGRGAAQYICFRFPKMYPTS